MTDVNASLREILNTQGQGFNAMLAGIQSGIGRIDASLQYARQKRDQKALIDYQMDKQIEKYKETVAIQKEADRELRQEQNNVRVLEQINKNAEIQQKAQKEINDQIVTANKTLREFAKPLMEVDFDITYLPTAVTEQEGENIVIKYKAITPDGKIKTYGSVQDFMNEVSPIMKFSGIAKSFSLDELDRATTKDGKTTYVGATDFISDKNRIASRSAGWEELAQEYITGKRVPNKRQPGNEADSQRKETMALRALSLRFNDAFSEITKDSAPAGKITRGKIETIRTELLKKIQTLNLSNDEDKLLANKYTEYLNDLGKLLVLFNQNYTEYIKTGKKISDPYLDLSGEKIIFGDNNTNAQAQEDSEALGG